MPKVGNITLQYGKPYGTHHDVWYTQKKGFEIRDLPEEILTLTDFHPSGYAKEADLRSAVFAAIEKYKELIKTERKVILYKCAASTHLTMNKVSKGHYSGTRKGISKKIDGFSAQTVPLATIGIEFGVYKVVDDGAKPKYYEIDMDTGEISKFGSRLDRSKTEIEFTEERYQFFLNIVDSMYEMVKKMSGFFGADPDKAMKFIEESQGLLLTNNQ